MIQAINVPADFVKNRTPSPRGLKGNRPKHQSDEKAHITQLSSSATVKDEDTPGKLISVFVKL